MVRGCGLPYGTEPVVNHKRLTAASAVITVSAALIPASAGANTPKGHLPLAFEATCEGLGRVAVIQPAGPTSWMVDRHWLLTSLRQTFVPDDGSDPVVVLDETGGRKTGLGEPITCTADFPAEGGIIRGVATLVPVPPK